MNVHCDGHEHCITWLRRQRGRRGLVRLDDHQDDPILNGWLDPLSPSPELRELIALYSLGCKMPFCVRVLTGLVTNHSGPSKANIEFPFRQSKGRR